MSQAGEAKDTTLRAQWSDQALDGLDRKLSQFQSALEGLRWPTAPPPWFEARVPTLPDEARGKVSGEVRPTGLSSPETKFFSSGFNAWEPSTLAAGAYSFDLSLGADTQTLSVDVASGDTWGDVLGRVRSAVNQAPLAARADVVYQNASFRLHPDMAGTGSVLTLSVNPSRDQDLSLADRSGHLLASLGLTAANNPSGPAQEVEYSVVGLQKATPTFFSSTPVDPRAPTSLAVGRHDLAWAAGTGVQPGTYLSKAFDPDQATTLAAGTYAFTSASRGETRSHTVTVGSGWNWGDVLRAVGAEINAQPAWRDVSSPVLTSPSATFPQNGVTAAVEYWPVPSATSRTTVTDGQSLRVTAEDGSDFRLADASGGLLAALGMTAKLEGAPVSFNVRAGDTWRDVFDSVGAAIGGAQQYLRAEVLGTLIPSQVTPGRDLRHEGAYLALTQLEPRIGLRVSLSDGRTGALAAMGIADRQRPGQDGKMLVNGQEQVSENGLFSQDSGRVLLRMESPFAETLPLKVASGMEELEKGWNRVTDAWNSLSRYLKNNQDLLDPSLGARLEAPLAVNRDGLRQLGVSTLGKTGQLWTDSDGFWRGLHADAHAARKTLWDQPEGLVPSWMQAVNEVRQARLENWLKPATSFDAHRPNLTSEFQLEQKHRLFKLLG